MGVGSLRFCNDRLAVVQLFDSELRFASTHTSISPGSWYLKAGGDGYGRGGEDGRLEHSPEHLEKVG